MAFSNYGDQYGSWLEQQAAQQAYEAERAPWAGGRFANDYEVARDWAAGQAQTSNKDSFEFSPYSEWEQKERPKIESWTPTGNFMDDLRAEYAYLQSQRQWGLPGADPAKEESLRWQITGLAPRKSGGLSRAVDALGGFMGTPAGWVGAGMLGANALGLGGAGVGEVAAGGAFDMAGSAGVGSALGGAGTASAAELAATGGALGTGAGETFGMTGLEGMTGAGGLGPAGGATGPLAGATMAGGMNGPAIGGLAGGGPGVLGGVGGVGGGVAAGSALSRIIDGTGTTADWTQVLGTVGATGLGMYSANQMSNTLEGLAAQNRAERQPFLSAATNYLDPNAWIAGPGQNFTQGTLQALSGTHGNPAGSPYSQQLATDAAMRNWMGGVNTLGSLGLGGQGINAQLGSQAAGAQADVWGNLAGGVSDIVNPRRSLADLLRDYKTVV